MFPSKFNYSLAVSKTELFTFLSRLIANAKRNNRKYIVCQVIFIFSPKYYSENHSVLLNNFVSLAFATIVKLYRYSVNSRLYKAF